MYEELSYNSVKEKEILETIIYKIKTLVIYIKSIYVHLLPNILNL